jgi:hypothetical protein
MCIRVYDDLYDEYVFISCEEVHGLLSELATWYGIGLDDGR